MDWPVGPIVGSIVTNSRRRCAICKQYFRASEMSVSGVLAYCDEHRFVRPVSSPQRRTTKKKQGMPPGLRERVMRRDGGMCRFPCPSRHVQVHHITYLSERGADEESNLVTLCQEHHSLVHSDKGVWQPALRCLIWMHYVGLDDGPQFLTANMCKRLLEKDGYYE